MYIPIDVRKTRNPEGQLVTESSTYESIILFLESAPKTDNERAKTNAPNQGYVKRVEYHCGTKRR